MTSVCFSGGALTCALAKRLFAARSTASSSGWMGCCRIGGTAGAGGVAGAAADAAGAGFFAASPEGVVGESAQLRTNNAVVATAKRRGQMGFAAIVLFMFVLPPGSGLEPAPESHLHAMRVFLSSFDSASPSDAFCRMLLQICSGVRGRLAVPRVVGAGT